MTNKAKIIEFVVDQDLCVGCGLCVSQSNNALAITMDTNGFWIPQQLDLVSNDEQLLDLCPFNPFPKEEVKTEDEISKLFLKDTQNYDSDIGRYEEIYAGYAYNYRESSSSGGMATYICNELLTQQIVDAIIVVREGHHTIENNFYEYGWITEVQDVKKSSKTRYFPVNLSEVMQKAITYEGKIAVVGVSCFIKGIRLLQKQNPIFRKKIPFLIGIICGGLKNKYYTEYLASHNLKGPKSFKEPQYRIKDKDSSASDYSFGCTNTKNNKTYSLKMNQLPDMWGTGYFKSNACDFCEDVAAELADISLGDAWIKPYNNEGLGNNVIISRSKIASELIEKGITSNELNIQKITKEEFKKSQSGSYNHRHKGLLYRIEKRRKRGKLIPPKRDRNLKKITLFFKIVQKLRISTRIKSTKTWIKYKNYKKFDSKMFITLKLLGLATKIYHKTK